MDCTSSLHHQQQFYISVAHVATACLSGAQLNYGWVSPLSSSRHVTCWLAVPADHRSLLLLLLLCREVKAALATAAAITSAEGGRTPLHLVVMGHVDAGGRWQQKEQPLLQVWNSSCKLGSGSSDSNCAWGQAVT
jgi:hypothetical protein